MKLNKNFGFILLIFAIIFAPISFSNIFVQSQTSDEEVIDGYQEWTEDKPISGLITVNVGATLVIKNGITLTFNGGSIDVQGKMVVSGTVKDPVKLQKSEDAAWGYSINIADEGSLIMRNADVSGAGYEVTYVKNDSILNTASAFFVGGINLSGGSLDIQGSSFHNNNAAISIESGQARVNRTKFFDNQYDVPQGSGDFRYNWWGSANGPSETCYTQDSCYYDKIDDQIDFSDFLKQEDFRDPVIIIPGILGSFDFWGEKKLDPFLRTYDYLYETFELNGYTTEQNLFTFPYEWRDSNIINAQKLKIKIDEIKQENNWPKVDIIAHSMGGLLAREYVESGYYGNDVDQLITLGTPQKGAPKDYLTWEGGIIGIKITDILDNLAEKVFTLEAHEKGFSSIFDYVQNRPITSVQELLPIYSYLYDNGNPRIYPANYPTNSFLETLNNSTGISRLNNIEFDNIVGNLDGSDSTISRIDVVESDDDLLWEHGYPEDFDALFGDHGLEYGDGDGTVPLESASLPTADEKIEINAKHGALPEEAAGKTFEFITKHSPQNISLSKRIKNIISIFVFSPIDIQVIAPDGKRVGRNFNTGENLLEIPGAYYTGYDTDSEFLTIPDPEDGEYKIITEGTGDGEYKIEAVKISENETTGETAESVKTIAGTAVPGSFEENTIEIAGAGIVGADENSEPEPVTISSIIGEVNGYAVNAKDKQFILNKLEEIRKLLEDNKKQNTKQINKKIDDLIKEIGKKNNSQISQPVKDILIKSLKSLEK